MSANKQSKVCPLCKAPTNKRDFTELKQLGDLLRLIEACFDLEQPLDSPKPKKPALLLSTATSKFSAIDIDENTQFIVEGESKAKLSVLGLSSAAESKLNFDDTNGISVALSESRPLTTASRWGPKFAFDHKTGDPPLRFLDPKEVRIATSGIPAELKADVNTFRLKFAIKNMHTSASMTHLVTFGNLDPEKKFRYCSRTFKVVYCIVNSIPIVDYRWIRECMISGKIIDPEAFLLLRDRVSDRGISRSRKEVGNAKQGFKDFFRDMSFSIVRTKKNGVSFKEPEIRS